MTPSIVAALLEVAKEIDELYVIDNSEFSMRESAAKVVRDKAVWYRSERTEL